MRKGILVFFTIAFFLCAICSTALAADITPESYTIVNGVYDANGNGDWWERSQDSTTTAGSGGGYMIEKSEYVGEDNSTHPQGTWNSPYTEGIDGYNYNDPQDYLDAGSYSGGVYTAGPHGGYLTTTHKCRECHAVHRASGKFKLTRANTRFEACEWCHGSGAGSGFNIQMDNDDDYTQEYNVGHTLGFGVQNGKWKAPDDTFPAYTPNYWLGGFACFDCHSPHANPQRLLGFMDDGTAWTWDSSDGWAIANPGHDDLSTGKNGEEPIYPPGSWILIKNPDREIATIEDTFTYYEFGEATDDAPVEVSVTLGIGDEIKDTYAAWTESTTATVTAGLLMQFTEDTDERYPVQKVPIDWNTPIGPSDSAQDSEEDRGFRTRNAEIRVWNISEFCTDCHDGNAGLSTVESPMYSEDRALRDQGDEGTNWTGNYDLGYGHDVNPRHCARQMKFNPEDSMNFGPQCRNCHKGSSDCGICHSADEMELKAFRYDANGPTTYDTSDTAQNDLDVDAGLTGVQGVSWFGSDFTTVQGYTGDGSGGNPAANNNTVMMKHERSVDWTQVLGGNWRTSTNAVAAGDITDYCSNDGFSWPHRTLGWKMLKDDLFGLDFDGTPVAVGETRSAPSPASYDSNYAAVIASTDLIDAAAHDIDSVCLDCHNPTVWNATSSSYEDTTETESDDFNDELILRGLP